nr:1522_t:CDS:2 [Entrophospora candida]
MYKSFGYSTGNLKRHLDEVHEKKEEALLKWTLKTNQPLSVVTNEAYIEKMKVFDPAFSGKSYSFNKEALCEIFQQRIDYVSLTTDFWASRAKHGYLGITASFIETDFSVVDIMLDIKYVPAVVIADSLYEMTDNGANMIASIQLLNQKPGCYAIKHLPHTLQLAIGKEQVEIKKCTKTFRLYRSLAIDAIIQLQTDLCTSTNREDKKDGNKLRKIMLSDEEWDLVDELITLLMPFEQATCE